MMTTAGKNGEIKLTRTNSEQPAVVKGMKRTRPELQEPPCIRRAPNTASVPKRAPSAKMQQANSQRDNTSHHRLALLIRLRSHPLAALRTTHPMLTASHRPSIVCRAVVFAKGSSDVFRRVKSCLGPPDKPHTTSVAATFFDKRDDRESEEFYKSAQVPTVGQTHTYALCVRWL